MNPEYDISVEELELIDQYLRNELSPAQANAFDEKLKTDKDWMKKVEDTRLLVIGVQEASLDKRLDSFHEEITTEKNGIEKGRVFKLTTRWAVAASVLIMASVLTALLLNRKNEFEKLYSSYYIADPGLLTAMGSSDHYSFEQGMVDYKNGEYKKAIQAWNSLLAQQPGNDTLHYFVGVAHQALGDDLLAQQHLEKVSVDNTHSFYGDACWYMGLLFLKQKQTDKAIDYIGKSNHPQKAALLGAINKTK